MGAKPVRILFDAQRLFGDKTGVEYYTSSLIKNLAEQYPELHITGFHSGRFTPNNSLPTARNIVYRRIWLPLKAINLLRRLHVTIPIELLTIQRYDFILYPNFLGLSSLFHTPYAPVIHDLTYIDLPGYVSKRNLHDLQTFIPQQLRSASFAVTVSEFGKKRIHEALDYPLDDILVTPIPASTPQEQSRPKRDAALHDLGLTSKYFLTLSTIEPRKNILGMLDAYLLLPEKIQKEYTFVIAGKVGWNCDEELARLDFLAKQGKNIIHLGYVTDEQRVALYQGATFYTSASHYEGFGMTPLEAMSYGIPCAISDIPVFKEVAGTATLYFDQQRSEAIKNAWLKLVEDQELRRRLSGEGKQHANSYKWGDVAISLYNRVMQTLESK
jgi:alpha-1,3-rhamnosyl/mannosyltransferase